jgi:hypothetical protein
MINFAEVNYLAVVVAAIAGFGVGAIWYGLLFSKQWIAAVGMTMEQMKREGSRSMVPFVLSIIACLVMAIVLSAFAAPVSVVGGATAGFLAWLGFVVTTITVNYAYPGRKLELTVLDSGHWLAVMVVMGAILGAFG